MPIVTKAGFQSGADIDFVSIDTMTAGPGIAIDMPNDADTEALVARFDDIDLIRIPFPSAQDGRGFSLARRLRDLGYRGRLRASGQVISDQFRYALDCGFDEVEIDDELAARQPEAHWRLPNTRPSNYREKLANYREKLAGHPGKAPFTLQSDVFVETVTEVKHYTDRLFKFRLTRPASFRFRSGEFVMIGLPILDKPVFRAYSIASPAWDDELEFFSIKVTDGALTAHLQRIRPGDEVLVKKKPTGTLVNDSLTPGKRLYLFSSGTGIAPFASLLRDPETYMKFEQVILIHTARKRAELSYGYDTVKTAQNDPLIGDEASAQLVHYATTTRERTERMGRITDLIETGKLAHDLALPPLDPSTDRAMICGSIAMLKDVKAICERFGLQEGANNRPAEFVVERAFAS